MIIDKIGNALNLIEFGKLQLQNEETIEMGYKVVYRGYMQLINNYAVLYYHPIINNKLKEKGKLKK